MEWKEKVVQRTHPKQTSSQDPTKQLPTSVKAGRRRSGGPRRPTPSHPRARRCVVGAYGLDTNMGADSADVHPCKRRKRVKSESDSVRSIWRSRRRRRTRRSWRKLAVRERSSSDRRYTSARGCSRIRPLWPAKGPNCSSKSGSRAPLPVSVCPCKSAS